MDNQEASSLEEMVKIERLYVPNLTQTLLSANKGTTSCDSGDIVSDANIRGSTVLRGILCLMHLGVQTPCV
jgi:hypothetical protein